MNRRHLATTALISVPALVLGLSIGGGAYAAQKIGKNLVVTKSIKNGAVTSAKLKADAVDGSKVKNGSLSAADLAPGTIPTIPTPTTPTPSKSVAYATSTQIFDGNNDQTLLNPVGNDTGIAAVSFVIAPLALQVADLHVRTTAAQTGGKSLKVSLEAGTTLGTVAPVLTCTVSGGTSECTSSQTATIPAGSFYTVRTTAGATGASTTQLVVGYSVRVP